MYSKTLFVKKQFSETFLRFFFFASLFTSLAQYLINPFFHKHYMSYRLFISRNILVILYKTFSPFLFPIALFCTVYLRFQTEYKKKSSNKVNQEGRSTHKQHQLPRAFVIYIVIIAASRARHGFILILN